MHAKTEANALELIRVAGFNTAADEVEAGKQTLAKTLHWLSRSGLVEKKLRPLFAAAFNLVGGHEADPGIAAQATRDYVEGRKTLRSLQGTLGRTVRI